MQIINTSGNLSTLDIYRMTKSPETQKMSAAKGQRLEVAKWVVYEDVNKKDDEPVLLLALVTNGGETYATNSATFINDFVDMWELFADASETIPAIKVVSNTSKAGREFITCVYSE